MNLENWNYFKNLFLKLGQQLINHITYMTVDFESNKYYVGRHSTKNLFDRYRGSGNWVRNYPKDKLYRLHTYVLEFFETVELQKIGEQILLDFHIGRPLCMNFSNNTDGFAYGELNPTNQLTEEQKRYRSENHWTKTEEGSRWISENNPSKTDYVKISRSNTQKELWKDPEYKNIRSGDNHWTKQDTESAKLHLEMLKNNNPFSRPEVIEKLKIRGPYPKIECPHCKFMCSIRNASRWHLDNCKQNPILNKI